MEKKFDIIVKPGSSRERIDIFLSREIGLSRSQTDKLIRTGQIKLNNGSAKPSYKIKVNDRIVVNIPPAKELSAKPEDIPLDIVFEDKDIIVINKPPGIVVHPAAGNPGGTLVNALLHHCKDMSGIGGFVRPGVVHRLDKDTSGLMVFAKNDAAHLNISAQIKNREVRKTYVALVHGEIKDDSGLIDAPIGRHPVHRKKMAVITAPSMKKREALTYYKVLKRFSGEQGKFTLVELDLKTGRTHQIRVHLSHLGHPVVGDRTYSKKKDMTEAGRQLLHATRLSFLHPATGKYLEFKSEIPGDMRRVIEGLGEDQSGQYPEHKGSAYKG
jgi:23S rRNA pseudouridine1911/1915/1917 synthase